MIYKTNFIYQFIVLLGMVMIVLQNAYGQTKSLQTPEIKGKLLLDSIWDPVAYLSHISNFNDITHMAHDMIISEATIDSLGNFSFATNYLPEEDQLYRIHISKKGDSRTSLIIGGEQENHIFIIANKSAQVILENSPGNPPFAPIKVHGYTPSKSLREIDQIYTYIDSTHFNNSSVKGEFVAKAIYEKLRFVADTSSNSLVSLYALYKSNFESNYPTNQQYYTNYLQKWKGEKSTYFKTFKSQFPQKSNHNYSIYILIGFVFFGLGFIINQVLRKQKKQQLNPIKKLSIQERKILEEIKLGRSNKEISEEFNIGLSTVKSHVSNIYSKLNIKSRKEAMDI